MLVDDCGGSVERVREWMTATMLDQLVAPDITATLVPELTRGMAPNLAGPACDTSRPRQNGT